MGATTNQRMKQEQQPAQAVSPEVVADGLMADNVALGNKVLVVFLSALKIRAPSNVFLLLLSVIWAQQSLVICC